MSTNTTFFATGYNQHPPADLERGGELRSTREKTRPRGRKLWIDVLIVALVLFMVCGEFPEFATAYNHITVTQGRIVDG